MKYLLIFLICLSSSICKADSYIYLGGWSYHLFERLETKEGLIKPNSTNDLVGLQYNNYIFSTFNNSYYDRSYLLGYSLLIVDTGVVEVNLNNVLYSGYDKCTLLEVSNDNCFAILPSFTFKTKLFNIQPSVIMIPEFIAISFRFKIK